MKTRRKLRGITKRVKNRLSKSKLVQKISRNRGKCMLIVTATAGVICVVYCKTGKVRTIVLIVQTAVKSAAKSTSDALRVRGGGDGESIPQLDQPEIRLDDSAIPNTELMKPQKLGLYDYFMYLVGKVTVSIWIVSLYTYMLVICSYTAGVHVERLRCPTNQNMNYSKNYSKNQDFSKNRGSLCSNKVCIPKQPVRKVKIPLAIKDK